MKEKDYLEKYNEEDSIELKSIINLILKNKFLIIGITLALTVVALGYTMTKPKKYTNSAELIQEVNIFSTADKIASSNEFIKNLGENQSIRELYSKDGSKTNIEPEAMRLWLQGKVNVSATNLDTTVNRNQRKMVITVNGDEPKEVIALRDAYISTMNSTIEKEKNTYYDEKLADLTRKLEILKDMKAPEEALSSTLDDIALMKLEKEKAKGLTPSKVTDEVQAVTLSKKKYGVMGFGGGLVLSLALIFGFDFLKGLKSGR